MKRALLTAMLLGSTIFATSAVALTAEQIVEREIVVKNVDGTETLKREAADTVVPGEKIVYSLNYFNDLDKPAENVVLVMPVPAELTFIEGSADKPGVGTTYSADGGKTFDVREVLQIKDVDETMKLAQSDDITHIKWVVEAIDPGERGTLLYKGTLK